MTFQNSLLKWMHKLYRKDKLTLELTKAISMQLYHTEKNIEEIGKQQYLYTAYWGLDIFEKELKFRRKDKLIEQRQAAIQAKWRGVGKLTLFLIQTTLQSYVSGNVIVRFQKYLFITMTSQNIESINMIDIIHTIEEVKPAHIGWGLHYILPTIEMNVLTGAMIQQSIFIDVLPEMEYDEWESETIAAIDGKSYLGTYIEIEEE